VYRRERIELPDGDFIDLDWYGPAASEQLALVLHGLEGGSDSHYVRAVVTALAKSGVGSVVMHHRGCSGEPNRLARGYHAGDTGDISYVASLLRQRGPARKVTAIGYSLGGNILVNYMGNGETPAVDRAIAVCVPFKLDDCAARLEKGFSRIYQHNLIGEMHRALKRKFASRPAPVDLAAVAKCRTFTEFDDLVTAPLHGFASARDYYERSSSYDRLPQVTSPMLIIHAWDDPFMTPSSIPPTEDLPPCIDFEMSRYGGHVGFVAPASAGRYWLEQRICRYICPES